MASIEQALIQKLEDHKYALDQAAIVAVTDVKGVITYVNDKFCEVSGYGREQLLGATHKVVNSGTHTKEFFVDLWQTLAQGQVWRGEVCNRKKNGELYWVSTTIVPLFDENGIKNQYLSIRFDITDLKRAQQTIMEQQEKLVAASRLSAIGEMAATITHEINNPLGVILGRAEMLRSVLKEEPDNTKEMLKLVDMIEVTGQRIEKIVRGMKTMAHHEREGEECTRAPVKNLIEDALDLCKYRFESHGIQIYCPSINSDIAVKCQSHMIVQVLVNLLNNAFDASLPLADKWVKLELRETQSHVEIAIIDSGSGISEETQKKMFNPFYSTKKVQYGTGLGLSISQTIVRKSGGTLDYDRQSSNTRFVISLPKIISID